jgi:sodium/hydrogen antiporter
MSIVLVFAVTLLAAVLVSALAERSVLSTAVLFLVAGFLVGLGLFGTPPVGHPNFVEEFAKLALFAVLFTDGMQLSVHDLKREWRLPGRALFYGMPLTIAGIALAGRYIAQMSWINAFLIGAALSPTDPVFVQTIFRIKEVPDRLKRLLNIESGLNDGLALSVVLVMLSLAGPHKQGGWSIGGEMVLGVAIGIAVPWIAIKLEQSRFFEAAERYQPLNAFAIGLIVLGLSYALNANSFLAAFFAGITIATVSERVRDSFYEFGELVAELLKLAALLLFAMLIAPNFGAGLSWRALLFIMIAVFAVRLVVFQLALLPSRLNRGEKLIAGWFGPKGFASVVYGYMILNGGFPQAAPLAHLVAVAIVASIVVYSSTDILIARWLKNHPIHEKQLGDESAETRKAA